MNFMAESSNSLASIFMFCWVAFSDNWENIMLLASALDLQER